jgi:hypothetical protein
LTASDYKKVDHVLAEFRSGAVVGGVDRTRIIFGSAEIAAIRAVSAMQLDDPRPRRTLDPGRTSPELRITNPAAQTRIVSVARIRLDSWNSVRSFKGIFCHDISEFESDHLSHAVRKKPMTKHK